MYLGCKRTNRRLVFQLPPGPKVTNQCGFKTDHPRNEEESSQNHNFYEGINLGVGCNQSGAKPSHSREFAHRKAGATYLRWDGVLVGAVLAGRFLGAA